MLARELNRISEMNREFRDFTLASLQEALREVVACFPNYRTYCTAKGWDEFDQKTVDTAVARALRRNPALEASIFEFLRRLLLPKPGAILPEDQYDRAVQFAMSFQQYTGPVQAKGMEDTAFYRYGVLLSLNEVGGDPARFGRSPDEFHRANQERRQSWPLGMLATATHDTKRGEDARARLNVLSELPDEWRVAVFRWARINAGMRTEVDGTPAPDRADEYIFYQSLIGSWPPDAEEPDSQYVERIRGFMLKATKEKKEHTSWINPSEAYDTAVAEFVHRTLTGSRASRFLRSFVPFAQRAAWLGMLNSLSQLVLKIASPGVPDFYQGTDLWDLSLVDPDNRGGVDYSRRCRLLEQLEPLLADPAASARICEALGEMLTNWQDGRIKLYLTAAGLRLRRNLASVFLDGEYIPLQVEGDRKDHVVAFARTLGDRSVVAIAPRLIAGLAGSKNRLPTGRETWNQNAIQLPPNLAGHKFRDVLTRVEGAAVRTGDVAQLPLADVLRTLPVALLQGAA
jgi:(1->4)-alpha-D-glucan 1-alpha-D-glucosylmutase